MLRNIMQGLGLDNVLWAQAMENEHAIWNQSRIGQMQWVTAAREAAETDLVRVQVRWDTEPAEDCASF
jgi:hypothetical protein